MDLKEEKTLDVDSLMISQYYIDYCTCNNYNYDYWGKKKSLTFDDWRIKQKLVIEIHLEDYSISDLYLII
jgi:hypothetical protein